MQDEKSGTLFARRFGRGLLWTVVALAAVTGVRSWFFPSKPVQGPPPIVKAGPAYPVDTAQAVAARFTRAYLTWDEENPGDREKALALDVASAGDPAMGWDGKGKQEVGEVYSGRVAVTGKGRARVHVEARVLPGTGKKGGKGGWLGLDVPVVRVGERVVVSGEPGLVGPTAPPANVPESDPPPVDAAMSQRTKGVLTQFFKEYAAGDTSTVAAPGAKIPALPAGIDLGGLDDWSVDAGKGSDRTGTAVVRWNTSGGAMEQTYRVVITRVASAQAERWQVSGLHGGGN
ncbi:conjugal transfer protein [Streptomyces sp. NPDC001922]|uniref:conjugal transfer protein n=1 Tax=Streptomyces sp. NPDC001922 TaxID=3364624 RepID=UPI00369A952E